ncbi:MAG TPA: type II methionyl aminopeptidase [Thermoplasmata archaeon]|nr:type II methionyl aminopeptidase [Thermoplasmata archaeon]
MDESIHEKYIEAGKIAGEVLKYCCSLAKPGVKLLDVAEKGEELIRSKGAGLAFPLNIGINSIAAHYTPSHSDEKVFEKGDLAKIDLGAHLDGYIADTARTVEIGTNKHSNLIAASKAALDRAIDTVKAGVDVAKIGKVIEEEIKHRNFSSINNLSGHKMERYHLHVGFNIPNVARFQFGKKLKEDYVIAIEPFATDGGGHVKNSTGGNIYLLEHPEWARYPSEKEFVRKAKKEFTDLPFSERWCTSLIPKERLLFLLSTMSKRRILHAYPQLVEVRNGLVAQTEHTVIVTEDGCEPTTRI